jgi:hypothetical protein
MLVPCQGCGRQIDTLAAACPHCGRPLAAELQGAPRLQVPPQMAQGAPAGKTAFGIWLAIGLGGLVVFIVVLKSCMGPGSMTTAFKDLAAASDTSKMEPMPPSMSAPAEKPAPGGKAIVIGAEKLYREYDDNEPAADEKYKGKLLEVEGPIKSIDKDFLGNIKLELDTGKIISGVTAKLAASEVSRATTLKKREHVQVRCKGAGRLLTSAMLEDCQILSVEREPAARKER